MSNNSEQSSHLALRYNAGKPELSYILDFPRTLTGIAEVMQDGAEKYDRNNWKKGGLTLNSYLDSALRHLAKRQKGRIHDLESGADHLFHAVVNLMMAAEKFAALNLKKEDDGNGKA